MDSTTFEILSLTIFRAIYLGAIGGVIVGDLFKLLGMFRDQADQADWYSNGSAGSLNRADLVARASTMGVWTTPTRPTGVQVSFEPRHAQAPSGPWFGI